MTNFAHPRTLLAALVAASLLAACGGGAIKPEQSAAKVEDRNPPPAPKTVATPSVAPITPNTVQGKVLTMLTDPNSPLSKRSVYFDLDQYVIKDEFKSLVENHAKFLLGHPDYKALIQGNADERGSREYNLALGQKRADALKKAMQILGAKEAQLESVSLGKEKPRAPGHDEAAWAENRRDDILYRDDKRQSGEF